VAMWQKNVRLFLS